MFETVMTWTHAGWGPWFLVFPLFWLGLAVFAIVGWRGGWRRSHQPSAEAILGERFARGEISDDEYRQRLGVLQRKGR